VSQSGDVKTVVKKMSL